MQTVFIKKHAICVVFFAIVAWILYSPTIQAKTQKPTLITIFVLDQCAFHLTKKLQPYFQYGLKELLDKGVVYTNAYHPHAIPETTTGHHCLSTGALPKDHGAVLNDWINEDYQIENYDEDNDPGTAVFKNGSLIMPGKSSKKTMTDSLSDQYVLSSTPHKKHMAFSLSLKAYPAIATATKLGKAIWFDEVYGGFTSSKAYFDQLPLWLKNFNKKHKFTDMKSFSWELQYSEKAEAYDFPYIKNYEFAGYPFSMVQKGTLAIDRKDPKPFKQFLQSPQASDKLLKLAKECLMQHTKNGDTTIVMWVLLSNLDLIGHYYGPDSLEVIDTVYHLDKQIYDFMKYARYRVGAKKCLFVMTADHGIPSIPELAQKRGFSLARRVMADPLIQKINGTMQEKYGVARVIKAYEPTYFRLNKEELNALEPEKKATVINDIKTMLEQEPGIRKAWTVEELAAAPYVPGQREYCYKTQIYPGRIGDIICMPQPYCQITHYEKGTSHMSPYEYDTHVPLVLYQPGRIVGKTITDKVYMTQLVPTLAHIIGINRPATAMTPILPGIGGM